MRAGSDGSGEERSYRLRFGLLVALVALVTVGRSFCATAWPTLYAEDGPQLFAHFRNHPGAGEVLKFYAGYVALAPNLIGYLSARVPATAAPYVLTGFALLLTVASRCVLYLKRFRFLLRSDRQRFFLCLLLTAAPVGNLRLFTLASYTIWHLLFLLLMLAAAPPPASARARIAEFPVLALAALSNPLSVVAIPLVIRNLVIRRDVLDRALCGLLLLILGGYLFLGVHADPRVTRSVPTVVAGAPLLVSERVVFEATLGNDTRDLMHAGNHRAVMWMTAGLVLLALARLLRPARAREPLPTRTILTLIGGILALSLLSAYGRGQDPARDPGSWNQRYVYVPQLLFLILCGIVVFRAAPWEKMTGRARLVALLVVAAVIVYGNLSSHRFHDTTRADGLRVAEFLSEVERFPDVPHRLRRTGKGMWPVSLTPGRARAGALGAHAPPSSPSAAR